MLTHLNQCRLTALFITLVLFVLSGCGFNLQGTTQVPTELKILILDSYDPYGPLTRSIEKKLRQSGIKLEKNLSRTDIPSLRIVNYSQTKDAVTIFRDGKTAEHQLILTLNAQLLIPEKVSYPISVTVHRSFFDNPLTALAKDAEQDIIISEMQEEAAQRIVRQLLVVNNSAQTY